ncbi:hypothetical protein Taro_001207, partial [Colocasia esculenta]|nr:hypothetical protein [Colocasia esculenta]
DVVMSFGARRRRPFLREVPNGFALRIEDSGVESLVELSWLVWDAEDGPGSRAESPLSVLTSRVVVTTSSHTEFSDCFVFPYRASCRFAFALPFVAAGRAPGGGDRAVGEDPVARSVSPFPVYVTLRDMAPRKHRQVRELVEQQGESEMPAQGQVREEVSAEEVVAAAAGAYQPGKAALGFQPPVPPPVVPEQQIEPEVEQLERQQWSGTGSTRAGRRRMAVTEDRTTLLERFLHLQPPMFSVSQYHQRFVRLLRHVPHVAGSEQACAERFIVGLRPDLRWGLTAHMCTTLGEAVVKATTWSLETWQPQQQHHGGASSKSSPYQRPARKRPCRVSVTRSIDAAWSAVVIAFAIFELSIHVKHAPLPVWNARLVFLGRSPEEALWNPPLLKTRPFWRSRSCRNGLADRDRITTLLSVTTCHVVVTTSSHTEFSDRVVFSYRASCSFTSAVLFVAAWRASGGGDGEVGEDPVASTVSPFPVYVTLGAFEVSGFVGGDHENRVLGVGGGSGSRVVT